jgi:hypothetical protein
VVAGLWRLWLLCPVQVSTATVLRICAQAYVATRPEELEFEADVWVCVKIGTAIFMGKMMIVHGNIGRTIFRQTCLLGAFGPGTFRNFMANTHGHWVAHRNLGADTQFLTT